MVTVLSSQIFYFIAKQKLMHVYEDGILIFLSHNTK